MINVDGYTDLQVIHSGTKSRVLKAIREKDGKTVVLKTHAAILPTHTDIFVLNKQYDLMNSMNIAGVPKPIEIVQTSHSIALAMECYDYPSLKSVHAELPLTVPETVKAFVQLADMLAQVHAQGIIHRDITPANILFDRATKDTALIDFGSALDIPILSSKGLDTDIVEGTPHYMSPEQTGRINRPLDHRTDLYSFGVVLYEILTGTPPCCSKDLSEIIHCHIATDPRPPHVVNPQTPKALSDITMKCLVKDSDGRYQSATGLYKDLLRCLVDLETTGEILDFPIAENDFTDRFTFPEKLYGRDRELQTLTKLYTQIRNGETALVMVSGHSGVGKTSLVNELNRTVASDYGHITYGKFDQYNRATPYSGLIQAFSSLIRQILTESDAHIKKWKRRILTSLGNNGAVITDIIPELEILIGKQPEATPLPPADARTRLSTVFRDFIQAFGSPNHPQVIFLDDLQWIDSSSLSLIDLYGSMDNGSATLFIGAYRSNEVSAAHPLSSTLASLKEKVSVAELLLEPISQSALDTFLQEMLSGTRKEIEELGTIIFHKTAGNPLFFRTLLTSLYESEHIYFDHAKTRWQWDIHAIKSQPYADNVVDALQGRIEKLPPETIEILKIGACTGSAFSLNFLSQLEGKKPDEMLKDLKPALVLGLITPSNAYHDIHSPHADEQPHTPNANSYGYEFAHDRIQQAAYALLEEERRPAVHLAAGRMLMKLDQKHWAESHLFDLTAHMQKALSLITDDVERLAVAQLSLDAGAKAKESTAFADASEIFNFARSILPKDSWGNNYSLTSDIYFELAETLSLSAQYEKAEELYEIISTNIARNEDELRLYNIKVKQFHYQARFAEAVEVEYRGLELMGIYIPHTDEDLMPFFGKENERIAELLENKTPEDLYENEENTDILFTRKLELLFDLFADSYLIGRGLLCGATASVMARLSMENGNNPMAAVSYINYASTVCSIGVDYPTGHAFGKLAVKLADKYNDPAMQNYAYHVFALAVNHWKSPLKTSHTYWSEASKLALASGSPYAGYVFLQLAHVLFSSGENLDTVERQVERSLSFLKGAGLDAIVTLMNLIVIQPVKHLRGQTNSITTLDDDDFQSRQLLADFQELPFFTGSLYYSMLRVACISGEVIPLSTLQKWIETIDNSQQGQFLLVDSYLYYALLLIEGREQARESDKEAYQEPIDTALAKMQNWATLSPSNCRHKYELLLAENGRDKQSLDNLVDLYDQAITTALDETFIQDAALAAEKAGKFWIDRGKPYVAKSYIEQACINYARWGATGKVEQLKDHFSEYLTNHGTQDLSVSFLETMTMNPFITGSWTFSEGLDLSSVIKATQAVSKHIIMDELVPDLVSIAIENAGATKGVLLVDGEQGFMISSSMQAKNGSLVTGEKDIHYSRSTELSNAVVNYVIRTGHSVVLDDARTADQFKLCEYIREEQPASICCIPIRRQNEIKAVLYLENDIAAGVFKQDRLQTLEIIAAQATISMENALVYQEMFDLNKNLETIVKQRTQELHSKNEELNIKNTELEHLSTTDQLTNIFNRRRLDEELEREINVCKRYNKTTSVILFDVDNFKSVNDNYGHSIGDDVLVKVAQVVSRTIRKTDILGRWGGEEFLVIVPEFAQEADKIADKIRTALEEIDHPEVGQVTVSLGVAVYNNQDTSSSIVSRADAALYKAKEKGRNCVVVAE
ncbi:MAG: diguanylate cyclase [Desulfovibrio sp.]